MKTPKQKKLVSQFAVIHQNVCSLRNKLEEVEVFLQEHKNYDLVCFSEHFMTQDEVASLVINGFTPASWYARHEHIRGGVVILAKNGIDCFERHDLVAKSVEMSCEVAAAEIKDINLIVLAIYRPPGGNFDVFLNIMIEILEILESNSSHVIIIGDFNVNFSVDTGRKLGFVDVVNCFGFTYQISLNTRQNACIDNIFVNFEKVFDFTTNVLQMAASDHLAVDIKIRNINKKCGHTQVCNYHRPITAIGTNNLYNILSDTDWSFAKSVVGANEKCNKFLEILCDSYNVCFPVRKYCDRSDRNVRWYDQNLNKMREHLRFLNDLYTISKLPEIAVLRNQYRQNYRKVVRNKKIETNSNFIINADNKVKAAWQIINDNRKTCKKTNISNNITADNFNHFFAGVAKRNLENLPQANLRPESYFQDQGYIPKSNSFIFEEVSFIQVRDAINTLNSKASKDIFGYNTILLKRLKDTLVIPLTYLINSCIREGVYPDLFRKSRVIPVHKKGDTDNINNYRPITLVPVLSKVLEYLLKQQLYNYFEIKKILISSQYGFRKSKSTTLAILSLLEYVVGGFEDGQYVGAILCDLSKAFDCIDHQILLLKLRHYGLHERAVKLIASYLTNRAQQTFSGGKLSGSMIIEHGVPQGSILGPLLFLIYINDIESSSDAGLVIFADDTTAILKDKCLDSLIGQMRETMLGIERWFITNRLSLNADKTENIIFTLRDQDDDLDENFQTDSVRLLGVYLDQTLIFETHITKLAKKLSSAIYCLKNLKSEVQQSVILMAYHSLFHSHCSYAILVWGHCAQASRVFALQRRAVRVIDGMHYRADAKPAFIKYNILTLPSVYILACLAYVKRNIESYKFCLEKHTHKTRNRNNINLEFLRLKKSRISTNYFGPTFFNKLPVTIRSLEEKPFIKRVKKYLLKKAFYTVQEFLDTSTNTIIDDFNSTT